MSGEGAVVFEGVISDNTDTVATTMPDDPRHHVDKENCDRESKSPRGSTQLESGVEQDNCVDLQTSSDTVETEARNHVSDGGDQEKSAPTAAFIEPDNELRNKIIKQVEFYFSDVNISKDSFLLKHVRRNKMGYVNIALVASFKKVKSLTRDLAVVVFSLRQSEELEVSEDGIKVRRCKPIPEYDETAPFRTVVVVNLGQKNPTVESVAEEFSKCQGITLIRIFRPGQSVTQDLNKYTYKHPQLGTALCAVIEFEKQGQAKKACKTMTNTEDWRNGRRVVLLANQKQTKKDSIDKNSQESGGDGEGKKKKGAHKYKVRGDFKPAEKSSSSCSSGSDSENPGSSQSQPCLVDSKSNGCRCSPESSPHNQSPGSSPRNHRRQNHRKSPLVDATSQNGVYHQNPGRNNPEMSKNKQESSQGETSPWVQRRLRASQDSKVNSSTENMVGVLRQPKGPDGTKGFSGGLGQEKPQCHTIT